MRRTASRRAEVRAGEQVELEVKAPGELLLPPELLDRLGLGPGDLVAFEAGRHSVRLELYEEFFGSVGSGEGAWVLAQDFLRQPSAAVLAGGRLPVPRKVVALETGERWVLQIVRRGLGHEIFLFRVSCGA